jgi:hypothetical protein
VQTSFRLHLALRREHLNNSAIVNFSSVDAIEDTVAPEKPCPSRAKSSAYLETSKMRIC